MSDDEMIKFETFGEEMIVKKYFQINVRYVKNKHNVIERVADWIIDPKIIKAFLDEWNAYQNRPPLSDG